MTERGQFVIISEEDFLALLPGAQRTMVALYAAIEEIPYSQAFAQLMGAETEENISDRAHNHAP